MAEPASESVKRFFGLILAGAGILILALSGLCTGAGIIFGVVALTSGEWSFLATALAIGAPPLLIGYGLFYAGRKLWRGPDKTPSLPPANFTEAEP
jgi:hypothetical protein